jgi:hypothetical protein
MPGPDWVNAVCARLPWTGLLHRPIQVADRVPCPWLIQIDDNSVAPTASAVTAALRAGARAAVRCYDLSLDPWSHLVRLGWACARTSAVERAG